ncbi:hypothetical protein PBY51_004545 [Eleginops maclovinus]|uniref:Uncharacterized protein n=1 Tax=Eleginops maclovinus TaxID=56733 RepID=A0AAN7Y2Z6_ELEMC|nr:hypothetical protein PBY51_004545 [Eleginops maclovinus]
MDFPTFFKEQRKDAAKYRQKLSEKDLYTQANQIEILKSEIIALKRNIEEFKEKAKENNEQMKDLLLRGESERKDHEQVRLELEEQLIEQQQSSVLKYKEYEDNQKQLTQDHESLLQRASAENEEKERIRQAMHEREIAQAVEENNNLVLQNEELQDEIEISETELSKVKKRVTLKEKEVESLIENMNKEIEAGITRKKLAVCKVNYLAKKREEELLQRLSQEVLRLRALPDYAGDLTKSQKECKELKIIIKKNKVQISTLKSDEACLVEDLATAKDRNTIINIKLEKEKEKFKTTDQKLRALETEQKRFNARLSQSKNENTALKGKISALYSRIKACQPLLIEERQKNQDLRTYIKRNAEDIQVVANVTDPKKLLISVAELKGKYVDNKPTTPESENKKVGRAHIIHHFLNQFKRVHRVHVMDAEVRERNIIEVQTYSQKDIDTSVDQINIINQQTHELWELRDKLRIMEKLLEKATDDTQPITVDSCIDEKYLIKTGTAKAVSAELEVPRGKRINVTPEDISPVSLLRPSSEFTTTFTVNHKDDLETIYL